MRPRRGPRGCRAAMVQNPPASRRPRRSGLPRLSRISRAEMSMMAVMFVPLVTMVGRMFSGLPRCRGVDFGRVLADTAGNAGSGRRTGLQAKVGPDRRGGRWPGARCRCTDAAVGPRSRATRRCGHSAGAEGRGPAGPKRQDMHRLQRLEPPVVVPLVEEIAVGISRSLPRRAQATSRASCARRDIRTSRGAADAVEPEAARPMRRAARSRQGKAADLGLVQKRRPQQDGLAVPAQRIAAGAGKDGGTRPSYPRSGRGRGPGREPRRKSTSCRAMTSAPMSRSPGDCVRGRAGAGRCPGTCAGCSWLGAGWDC